MTKDKDKRLTRAMLRFMDEQNRVHQLSNVYLVQEILNSIPFGHWDAAIEEACTRLDPTWNDRESIKP